MANTAEQHATFKRAQLRERIAERQSLPLPKRISKLLTQLGTLSSTSAAKIGQSSPSVDTGVPSSDGWLADMPKREVQAHFDQIIKHVEALENALDRHMGFQASDSKGAFETTQEKDARIIKDFVGFTPAKVSAIAPELGDPMVIRKVRKAANVNPETGQ